MMFPGTLFGDPTDDYVRISVLQPAERMREACARMAGAVKSMSA